MSTVSTVPIFIRSAATTASSSVLCGTTTSPTTTTGAIPPPCVCSWRTRPTAALRRGSSACGRTPGSSVASATAMRSFSGPASRTFCWPKRTASPLCSRPLRRSTIRSGASTCACTTSWCFIPATAVTSPTSSPSSARVAPSSARPSGDAVRPSLLCPRTVTTAS